MIKMIGVLNKKFISKERDMYIEYYVKWISGKKKFVFIIY